MARSETSLPTLTFANEAEWDEWLCEHAGASKGLWLKFAKQGRATTVSKSAAIDVALCHGWVDGQLASLDDDYFVTRFTPRRTASIWSQNNQSRALALISEGRMQPAGLAQVEKAKADGRWERAYASQGKAQIPDDLRQALEGNAVAARFFETLSGANRFAILYRLHNARKPETRARKLAEFIGMLEREETIHSQKRG